MKVAVLVWTALMAAAAPAFAQQQELVLGPQFELRFDELAKWLREYQAWEKWFEVWGNKVAHNFDGQPLWERMKRPDPPVWLAAECEGYLDDEGLLASACYILGHWDEAPLAILERRQSSLATSGGKVDDKVVKSSFFHRVHLTGLWMQARYPATPTYGIVGMQVGMFEAGRFTLPAIGVMLVMIPDGHGGHSFTPATTFGFGYRICDFVPPLMNRQVSLHINLARTSLHGVQGAAALPVTTNVNLFGLSVSARKRR